MAKIPGLERHKRPGDIFTETLTRDGLIVAPGTYNAMGGYIAKKLYTEQKVAGLPCTFNAVYQGHWSTSAMNLRKPDMGFVSMFLDFILTNAKLTADAAYPLPMIFDIETGLGGNETTVHMMIEKCDKTGVAVIHWEDQAIKVRVPRRCGNHAAKLCAEIEEAMAMIEACLEAIAQLGSSMHLMVRTDAITAANGNFENAIERGKHYMSIEANGLRPKILWADAMYQPDHIDRWIEEFRKFDPNIILGINYSPNRDWTPETYYKKFGQMPPTYDDLYRNGKGFSVIWHTILQARTDMEATYNTFNDMAKHGARALWTLHERQRHHPVGDAQAMSGVKEWQVFEQEKGGKEAVERYEKSQGYSENKKNN